MGKPSRISVVIPALNEGKTVAGVVAEMSTHRLVDEVIVVDNASDDDTAEKAKEAGATVLYEETRGYGYAVKKGLTAAKNDLVFKCCSDLRNPQKKWIDLCLEKLHPECVLVKGAYRSPHDPLPVTKLLVKPALRCHFPSLLRFDMPISGQFLMRKSKFDISQLADDFALDIDMMIRAEALGLAMDEAVIGDLLHADRSLDAYSEMSFQILKRILEASSMEISQRVVMVMAHPDDAVIWCGGFLAKYLASGANVSIICATGNEKTAQELDSLKKYFPTVSIKCLFEDEFHINIPRLMDEIMREIDVVKSNLLITHHNNDPHPDHKTIATSVHGALMKVGNQRLPKKVLMCSPYFRETPNAPTFMPDIYLDITAEAKLKSHLIKEHTSQNPEYWMDIAQKMDSLAGVRSGTHFAEAYQTMTYYGTPKAHIYI